MQTYYYILSNKGSIVNIYLPVFREKFGKNEKGAEKAALVKLHKRNKK